MKHGTRFWKIGMQLLLVLFFAGGAEAVTRLDPIQYVNMDDVIYEYELRNIDLNRYIAIGGMGVHWNQRMVGDAIVEGATTVVQFNPAVGEYVELQSLRPDVVDNQIQSPSWTAMELEYPSGIGDFQKAQLYILKPDSAVFPVISDPTHPSWVVYSSLGVDPEGNNLLVITIFDSVNGEFLGYGTSPPYTALSIGGPDWGDEEPCDQYYHDWMISAQNGFDDMGYDTDGIDLATAAQIQGHVESSSTALFYELNHGGSTSFHNICPDSAPGITGTDVGTWINDYTKMPFAFIGSCGGLCSNGPGTFSYEFRKADTVDTAAIGYCHMDWTGSGSQTYDCTQCWANSIPWQDNLFDRLNNGETVEDAFNHALADYPMCGDGSGCMRLDGDPNLALVPAVMRGSLPTSNAGTDQILEQTSLAGTLATLDGSSSSSPNNADLIYTWSWTGGSASGVNPTASFPLGTSTVTLTVDDGYGSPLDEAQRSDTVSITIVDTTPPDITSVSVDPNVLWPPNHKMVPVTIAVSVTDICDAAPSCQVVWVSSNEPENGLGDGDTAHDWSIMGDFNVNLRAERSGKGSGRAYTIIVQCTDDSGNIANKDVEVTVPSNM